MGEQRVRIVAGEWRGRRLLAPKGTSTRPTSDMVRGAVFSSLASVMGSDLGGVRVLDAFAGSGALALEALSRGALSAVMVDNDSAALASIRANVTSLGAEDRARVVAGDVTRLVERGGLPEGPFGLLMLDPPYRIGAAEVNALVEALNGSGALLDGCVVVWEHDSAETPVWPDEFEPARAKRYGTTGVDIVVARGGVRT